MLRSIIVLYVLSVTDCARILALFPTPSVSHQVVFRPLTQELARRGHEVVVITTDPAFPRGSTPGNFTEIDVHEISYKIWRENFMATSTGKKTDLITQIEVALKLLNDIFLKQVATKEIQDLIQNHNNSFDLLFIEACVRPALVFSHIFKVPTIQVSSFSGFLGNFETIGAPIHPLLFPLSSRQRIFNLSVWEKMSELYNYYILDDIFQSTEVLENEAIREIFGRDVPPLSELRNNVQMLFLNVHPIWDQNRPVPPSVVYMGGVHRKPKKDLPEDLKSYLDFSKHGVIYVSFGTNVSPSLLPPDKIQAMVNALSQLPYDILWKWDQDELPGRTKNIKISKWLPQSDLLRHPKVRLFITQAGLQSTDEAVIAGVPLIAIPILGDQWYNAEKYVQLKIGMTLEIETLTSEILKSAVETVFRDESYRQNIAKYRSLMQDQQTSPLERVVWWTEHVLRHGGAGHLKSPTANMSWAEFLEMDVVAVVAGIILMITSLACVVIYYAYVFLIRLPSKGKMKQS